MRVFLLEDSAERLKTFSRLLAADKVDRGTTLREGYHHFKPPYDLILLDHDLEAAHYKDLQLEIGTGTEFVKWLTNRYLTPMCPVIVHSMNFFGRRRMCEHLDKEGWEVYDIPFGLSVFAKIAQLRHRYGTSTVG